MVANEELLHAQRAESFWTVVEFAVPLLMMLTAPIFEDAEIHEVILGSFEGFAIWRKRHWKRQIEVIQQDGRRTSPDYLSLIPHISDGIDRRRNASSKRNK